MTFREILAAIQGKEKRRKEDIQFQALIAYRQSDLIAKLVSIGFGTKQQVPTINEAFPGIFPEIPKNQQQNWQVMKARVEAYNAERRKRGEQKNGDN